ncbi:hypothetical protein PLICRDRAFT_47766 [Plicaturopsis crispa FD-325 SS-3]|nr:hypothetical protein PLICRDRAFT_47766 [Plicaturopsis crispa FD-325 SS-3]
MEKEIQQLVEMGATALQARAALAQYKDVMQAAERIFDGQFDDIADDDGDVPMDSASVAGRSEEKTSGRMVVPDGFVDYDSDYDAKATRVNAQSDPYSGIFFSKDRREEVIEVEEEPEIVLNHELNERVKIMTQGEWMKGCPEGGEQSFLFSLYNELSQGECPCPNKCGHSVRRKKEHFFAIYSDFTTYIDQLKKILRKTCPSCRVSFCFACGEPISEDKVRRPTAASDDDPLFHCSNLQGVILGIGLSMVESLFAERAQDMSDDSSEAPRTSKKRKMASVPKPPISTIEDDDDYYPTTTGKKAKSGGIGYAGDQREDNSGQLEAQALEKAKDEKVGLLLSQIRVYLPSLHRPGGGQTSDYLVHPTALAHLRRRFNHVCSTLLRNDSLADMSDRSVLYFELFYWLETISNHEALASMMAMPIMAVATVKAITPKKSHQDNTHVRERTIVYEGSSSPRELLEAISIQAQAAIKGLERAKPVEEEPEEMTEEQKRMTSDPKGKQKALTTVVEHEENVKLLKFCQRILATANGIDRSLRETKGDAFVERLHASLPKIATSSSDEVYVTAGATPESAVKAYLEWANRVRFEYCDLTIPIDSTTKPDEDTIPHYKFYYNNDARMLASSDIPKRSLAIAKELAVLTTNLPVAWDSSIFLRVDESRVDVIKALITGPEGTPYLFDIFLGSSYNQSPPSVKYMTTHGGVYRFNPNLYADGKVCLSLLGTWQGPGWIPGKSTLLQVLISIQSMILCEEPYLNEPSWANSAGTPQSKAYSANVRRMVTKTAILGNLKNPPEPFGDIVRTHFRLKAREITAQVDRWLAEDDGKPTTNDGGGYHSSKPAAGGSSSDFRKDVEEIKSILKKMEESDGAMV